ncbi:MAG: restriction endonuclease subunit S [Candidatus Levyibacteriota bacterium]
MKRNNMQVQSTLNQATPKLRFSGFKEEWVTDKFGSHTSIIMGQSPDGNSYNKLGKGSPLINGPTEFTNKYPIKIQWTSKPTKICKPGDVLLCVRGSSTGRMNIADDHYCIGRGIAAITSNSRSDSKYVQYLLELLVNRILRLTSGSTFPNVDKKSLNDIITAFPNRKEQKKIASFLSSIDDWIENLRQQKASLEKYKKGIMQKIFSQEIRFKDETGKEFPKWEIKKLGDIFINIKSGKDKPNDYGEYNIYGSTGVIGTSDKYSYEGEFILIARVGAYAGKLNKVRGKFGVTDNTLVLESPVPVNMDFFFNLLNTINIRKLVFGSGQPLVTSGHLRKIEIKLPCVKEQMKIAEFLSSVDNLIQAKEEQIKYAE